MKLNPILLGTAEPIDLVREEVRKVADNEGWYIATDVNQPGAEVMLASVGGKIYCMKMDKALDPERFLETVRFSGPFRAEDESGKQESRNL